MDWPRRAKLLSIVGECRGVEPITRALFIIDGEKDADHVYDWLLKRRLTGRKFLWFLQDCGGSPLDVIARVRRSRVVEQTIRDTTSG